MGYLLKKYLEYITATAGPMGKARMVLLTGITEKLAQEEPDTEDRVAKVRSAIRELTGREAPLFELNDNTGQS